MKSASSVRMPVALEPRIQQMDKVLREQRREIESLRASLALIRTGQGAGWWREDDISLKVAKLLRVLRVKYVKPHSVLERLVQWVHRAANLWLEAERRRSLTDEDRTAEALSSLGEILTLADPYALWRTRVEPHLDRLSGAAEVTRGPLISVVLPVYKVAPHILEATLRSLRAQTYRDWEACIAFADGEGGASLRVLQRYVRKDRRIKLEVLPANYGISGNSNAALKLAHGDYIALLDHDDELPPIALSRMAAAIRAAPSADFLYTDKDLLSERGERRYQPLFKPEWSPEMLYSVNYLTHLNLIRADLMTSVGGWAKGVDGAQDWDLFLRVTEKAKQIVRVPGVGYSWRVHQTSTASGLEAKPYAAQAQLRSLERHAARTGLAGTFKPNPDTGFRIRWRSPSPVRVIVLAGRDKSFLDTLIVHLGRERESFTGVDVLMSPKDIWAFSSAWRRTEGPLPRWCRLVPIIGSDPVKTTLGILDDSREPVTVFLDGGAQVCTPGAFAQLSGWLSEPGPIAFASGVTVESDTHVAEAGCVIDQAGVVHPLFRGEALRHWNVFGGALWHRNVELASPYLLALRTEDARRALAEAPRSDWQGVFHHACQSLVTERNDGRGVVDPNARAILAPGAVYPAPSQGMIGPARRYLHPFLTISDTGGIALSTELADHAAILAA